MIVTDGLLLPSKVIFAMVRGNWILEQGFLMASVENEGCVEEYESEKGGSRDFFSPSRSSPQNKIDMLPYTPM